MKNIINNVRNQMNEVYNFTLGKNISWTFCYVHFGQSARKSVDLVTRGLTLRALSVDVSACNFSLLKLPQTAWMSQISSASLVFFILTFSVICLNETCRRHQEIRQPRSTAFLGARIAPRARRGKVLTQLPEG